MRWGRGGGRGGGGRRKGRVACCADIFSSGRDDELTLKTSALQVRERE